MKGLKRFVSMVLLFCIMISLLPPVQFARAAETTYRYELDTDGIDVGATYLIVSKNIGSQNPVNYAMMYNGTSKVQPNQVAIQTDGEPAYIATGFANEAECQVQFTDASSGYIEHGEDRFDLKTLTFGRNAGLHTFTKYSGNVDGAYCITSNTTKKSLDYTSRSNWTTGNQGKTYVFLFKLVEVSAEEPAETFDVTYDANGKPDAILPGNETGIEAGKDHIVCAPNETQVTVDGKIYEFAGWNTKADGSGTSYKAGDVIKMTDNVTLYAQWVQQVIKYNAVVKTKLDDSYWNISGILEDTVQLYLRKGNQSWHMDGTNDGTYSAQVEGNGTYTVYMQYGDAEPVETAYTLTVTDQDAAIEIAYYSVTYMSNGAVFRRDVYPAGTKITVIGENPYSDEERFLGWMNSANSILSAGTTITASIQEKVVMTARWERIGDLQYIVRYREKGTEKELLEPMVVEGVAKDTQVLAEHVVQVKANYSYVGAGVNGVYIDKSQNPYLTISEDESKNVITVYYLPDPDLHLHKDATLKDDGTYTIEMDMFIHENPVTTLVQQKNPLDIVLVLDQSSSLYQAGINDDLQRAVNLFVDQIANHGRDNKVDHRLAIVGFANEGTSGAVGDGPVAGSFSNNQTVANDGGTWVNTGVFDAHGDFHVKPIIGFAYEEYENRLKLSDFADAEGNPLEEQTAYYTLADGEYVVLDYLKTYRHRITAHDAYNHYLNGTPIFGYVGGEFLELTRNTSGQWLLKESGQLYSFEEYFTAHHNVLTHRHGLEGREIHATLEGDTFVSSDGHAGIYTRKEVAEGQTYDPDKFKSVYADAMIPVNMGADGSGFVDPAFKTAINHLGAAGETHLHYGMEMAQKVFEATPLVGEGRQRVVIVFTDGKPGNKSEFDEIKSNASLNWAAKLSNPNTEEGGSNALIYTIGLYGDDLKDGNADLKDQQDFLDGLSSNFPTVKTMDEVWGKVDYIPAQEGFILNDGSPYYVEIDDVHYPLQSWGEHLGGVKYKIHWYYEVNGKQTDIITYPSDSVPKIGPNGDMDGITIYRKYGIGYNEENRAGDQYYYQMETAEQLEEYFATLVRDLTTKISEEVKLPENLILRDIMGQGLVLTPGTKITVYKEKGTFIPEQKYVQWSGEREPLTSVTVQGDSPNTLISDKYVTENGTEIYIGVYNLHSQNPTDPKGDNYHPHTVDITGYDLKEWYMNAGKLEGFRLVATITRVEAMANVPFGRATATNHAQSGLWLPGDEEGNRVLLEAFDQPSTVFVERAYVLDYGKSFQLSGWYFDDEDGKEANAIHVDCQIENGMNYFDKAVTANNQGLGNTTYGNVAIRDGNVTYTPVTTQWGGYDQFYVFGSSQSETIKALDANQNGNLWNKVTVIPANNIYYEDSFITTEDDGTNHGVSGFVFSGDWLVEKSDPDAGSNVENPEHMEVGSYKEVHGWTDSLADDQKFTDGSAHVAFKDGYDHEKGARVEFSFTGTGVEVYSRTNAQSGWIVAFLYEKSGDKLIYKQSLLVDDLAVSGDYYHIPTVFFKDLDYGTYSVMLVATEFVDDSGKSRAEYYIDGIRIINPMGQTIQDAVVKEAYGLESNAVFTEVRDILIDNGSFNADKDDFEGAVFIDQLKKGQAGAEQDAAKVTTYDVGVFEAYGPKNEVYLSSGQAIVLKVEEGNTYYVGLKSLKGGKVTANLSGIEDADPTAIEIGHTTDLYYRVTPVDGYIVIQNGSEGEEILSITNLRTTNLTAPAPNGGVLRLAKAEAVAVMDEFTDYLLNKPEEPVLPEEEPVDENQQMTDALFASVRQWIVTD